MTVFILTTGYSANTLERAAMLKSACQKRGVGSVNIETTTADRLSLPHLRSGDALYNATRGGIQLETLLWRPWVTTFYKYGRAPIGIQDTTHWIADHVRAGIPQPRTILHASSDRDLLEKYVHHLGGFPLIVKVAGSTLGTGVIRVDSWPALFSTVDYLVAKETAFILREYLSCVGSYRLMVIGSKVVGTLAYDIPARDFRTNAKPNLDARLVQVSAEIEALAVAAVDSMGAELGGVDVVCDDLGRAYVLESNLPCGFANFSRYGVDVPGMMIDYLAWKAKQAPNDQSL